MQTLWERNYVQREETVNRQKDTNMRNRQENMIFADRKANKQEKRNVGERRRPSTRN